MLGAFICQKKVYHLLAQSLGNNWWEKEEMI